MLQNNSGGKVLACLHDVGQGGVAGLVQAKVWGECVLCVARNRGTEEHGTEEHRNTSHITHHTSHITVHPALTRRQHTRQLDLHRLQPRVNLARDGKLAVAALLHLCDV